MFVFPSTLNHLSPTFPSPLGRRNRNDYAQVMLHMLKTSGQLEGPFESDPVNGRLPHLDRNEIAAAAKSHRNPYSKEKGVNGSGASQYSNDKPFDGLGIDQYSTSNGNSLGKEDPQKMNGIDTNR